MINETKKKYIAPAIENQPIMSCMVMQTVSSPVIQQGDPISGVEGD